ncbi:MAG: sugar phosphate isomerase/epimerase [Planctomycetaceae bacterium]|nr:sugar phosphate isomerase/epimerase [Planctomycetaceae bacterium]
MTHSSTIDRRTFLQTAALTTGALALRPTSVLCAADDADPYGGFKMSIQSYSLRAFDVDTALAHSQKLGLKYWEAFSGHIPMSTVPAHIKEQRAKLDDAGITLLAYGVLSFDDNETKAREIFDFAQAMGLVSISANPKKEDAVFDLLGRMVEEYGIPIAIHNHGPNATYDKIDDVVTWTKDRHPLIGACVDTGHYLRSDEDPVEAIERLQGRVFGVHLKDVKTIRDEAEQARLKKELPKNAFDRLQKEGKLMTILGEGELDVPGCLKALRAQNYDRSLSLEYEENEQNPLSDIEVCLKTVREAVKTLG